MEEIEKVTIEELDVAESAQDGDKLIIEGSDGKAKSISKNVLFSEEKSERELADASLQIQINTMAGITSDESGFRVVEKLDASLKGVPNGVAELDADGLVPSSQLPSYVDDVIEGYYNKTDGKFYRNFEGTVVTHDVWSDGTNFLASDTSVSAEPAGEPGGAVSIGNARYFDNSGTRVYYKKDGSDWFHITTFTSSGFVTSSTAEDDEAIIEELVSRRNISISYIQYSEITGTYSGLITPESGKVYVDLRSNLTYRWSGTMYTGIASDLALGETSSTAYRGDKGKVAYDHSQVRGTGIETATNPHALSKADIELGNVPNVTTNNQTPTYETAATNSALTSGETLSAAFGKLARIVLSFISHIASVGHGTASATNPHGIDKSDVGLGNVENYGRSTTVQSGDDKYITGGAVYTELAKKQNNLTGAVTTIVDADLAVGRALVSNANGKVDVSSVTATELGELAGITGNVQAQLDNSVHYCSTLPANPVNNVYGINESKIISNERLKKFVATYMTSDGSKFVPKNNLVSTSLSVEGVDEVNVLQVALDYSSINEAITGTGETTPLSGTVTTKNFYFGDSSNSEYYKVGSGDGSGNSEGSVLISSSVSNAHFPMYKDGNLYVNNCAKIVTSDDGITEIGHELSNGTFKSNVTLADSSITKEVSPKVFKCNSVGLGTTLTNTAYCTWLRYYDTASGVCRTRDLFHVTSTETAVCSNRVVLDSDCGFLGDAYCPEFQYIWHNWGLTWRPGSTSVGADTYTGDAAFTRYNMVTNPYIYTEIRHGQNCGASVCMTDNIIFVCQCTYEDNISDYTANRFKGRLQYLTDKTQDTWIDYALTCDITDISSISCAAACLYFDTTANRPMYFDGTTAKCIVLEGEGGVVLGDEAGCALGTASAGSSLTAARSDHVHPLPTCVACAGTAGTAASATSATSAVNSTCFNGCTFAQACTTIRSGLTSCTGTVTVSNVTANADTPIALCSGATSIGKSSTCPLTFNAATGELKAKTFTGCFNGSITCAYCVYKIMATNNTDKNLLLGESSESAGYGNVYVGNTCKATFNTATGVLTAKCFCGTAYCAANSTLFNGCTLAQLKTYIKNQNKLSAPTCYCIGTSNQTVCYDGFITIYGDIAGSNSTNWLYVNDIQVIKSYRDAAGGFIYPVSKGDKVRQNQSWAVCASASARWYCDRDYS